jgi:hypothetical protein
MHSTGNYDCLFLSMITQISVQPISESSEKGTRGQKVILIVLEELLDLLFERSL